MANSGSTSPKLSLDTKRASVDQSRPRSYSIANERLLSGTPTYSSLIPPPADVSPDPAYIAPSAASQIITNDHDHHAETWNAEYGIEPSGETVIVAESALKAVNGFLDQLLFSFITKAEATSLSALRPSVAEVLKPKLAKDAIYAADQELHDYLGNGDDEALLNFHTQPEPVGDWDPERVWKRTRLRCMVYSSLGDMEEDEEDRVVWEQQLDGSPTSRRYQTSSFVVSPAVAIFLTSILECIGEQALVAAGQQAYHRIRAKREKEQRDGAGPNTPIDMAERTIVEECDTDKLALDTTLGRLWRSWRKSLRSPTTSVIMARSRDSVRSREHSRSNSSAGRIPLDRDAQRRSILQVLDQDIAASVPLPMSEDDVREIEVPGLVDYDDEIPAFEEDKKTRPKSMMLSSRNWESLLTPDDSEPHSPTLQFIPRKRSNSLPTPLPSPYDKPFQMPEKPSIDPTIVRKDVENDAKDEKLQTVTEHPDTPDDSGDESPDLEKSQADISTADFADTTCDTIVDDDDRPMSKDSEIAERYFVERPKIMTSHRVSMGGTNSPIDPLSPRPTSVRSMSVHSIRLIDVPSRSPARTQHSADVSPIRSPAGSPFIRNASGSTSKSSRSERTSTESITEEPDFTTPAVAQAEPEVIQAVPDSRHEEPATTRQGGNRPRAVSPATEAPIFVLAPAPASHKRVASDRAVPESSHRNNAPESSSVIRAPGSGDSGAPPLTPLREMMEGATDTSDEASSNSKSRSHSEVQTNELAPAASAGIVGQHIKSEQHRRPVPTEKLGHHLRKDSTQKPLHEVVNRSNRSISQSSSATSYSNKVKAMRTSSDYGEERKGQSFEDLIRSDQTIQYTLTPQSMREIESPDSALVANPPNFPNEKANGSTPPRPNTSRSYGSVNRYTSLRSNPPSDLQGSKPFQLAPRPVTNNSNRSRPGAPQARDAKVRQDSLGDLADFIRSTGPPGSNRPPQSSSAASGRGLSRNASASFTRPGAATPVRRSESSAGRTKLLAREAKLPHSDNNSDLIDFIRQGPPSEGPRIPRTVAPFRTTMDSDQMAGAFAGRSFDPVLPEARMSQTSTNVSESMHSSVNSQSALLNNSNRRAMAPARSYSDFEEEDMMPKRKTRRVLDPYAIDSDEEDEELYAQAKKPQRHEESLIDFLNSVPPPSATATPATEPNPKAKALLKKKPSRGLMSRFSRSSSSSSNVLPDAPPPSYTANFPRASTGSRSASHAPQPTRVGTSQSSVSTIRAASATVPKSHGNVNCSSTDGAYEAYQQHHTPSNSQHKIELDKKPTAYQPARGNYVSQLDTERKPVSRQPPSAHQNGRASSTAGPRGATTVQQRPYQVREAKQVSEGTQDLAAFLMSAPPPPSMQNSRPEPFLLKGELHNMSGASSSGSGGFSRMFRKKKAVGGYA